MREAENIVNSRPLTYQSDLTRDVPLSPSQLAWGRDPTLMPPLLQPGDPLDEDPDARATQAQYELLSNALECFRKRWHNEYLLSLRDKHYNRCAENPTHHLSVGKLVMVCHDNVHRIEWPLGVITAIYPDDRGVITTAEVEECGKRSLRPVLYLVPLELDCHNDDDALRLCPRDPQRNEEEDEDDDDDDEEDAAIATNDSLLAENQGGSNVSADAEGQEFLPDASYAESLHTSGSSRASGLGNGTTTECNLHTNATTKTPSLPPATVVTQAQEGEERDAGWGAAPTTMRPQRRAAQRQRALLGRLIRDDQL